MSLIMSATILVEIHTLVTVEIGKASGLAANWEASGVERSLQRSGAIRA
jgi:hypothetical protein